MSEGLHEDMSMREMAQCLSGQNDELKIEKYKLKEKLNIAMNALEEIATPALGGKLQQWSAQLALQQLKGE